MNIIRIIAVASLLASIGGLTACNTQKPGTVETAGRDADQSVAAAADTAGQAISDTALTTKVKTAILAEPSLKVMQISVATTNGVVTLGGDVDSKNSSALAVRVARSVDGVSSVVNNLVVKSKSAY
jgi:hyperosmotically inducible protein